MALTAYQLDMRATRLLRLANGKRTLDDLCALLGMTRDEMDEEIRRLRHEGCAVHIMPKPNTRGRKPTGRAAAIAKVRAGA